MILSAIISLNNINQLIFVMMNYVLFEVWTEFLSSLLYSRLSSRVTLLSIFSRNVVLTNFSLSEGGCINFNTLFAPIIIRSQQFGETWYNKFVYSTKVLWYPM
jgi:hypothetical protein